MVVSFSSFKKKDTRYSEYQYTSFFVPLRFEQYPLPGTRTGVPLLALAS
jgi:hypothetical protein